MSSQVPFLALNNGQKIPVLGLGTWQGSVRLHKEVISLPINTYI